MPERYLGQTLGKYRIDAIVGTGGFAWVYKAYDPELDIPVALKILKPQYAGDEKFEERFRREASTAAKLRHPSIIKIYAVGREGDAVYFAMDYLPQGLADRLNVMSTLPESMLIRMAIDVSSALGFAHREGVIHRDIKTDNILFDDHGNAIVADFGIARAVSGYAEQTGTNMVVGTPQYFSPEQARGLALDGRADLYSLGVTLFKAATGVLPFTGDDWYEIARQHVEDPPPAPRTLNPSLTQETEEIILQCLEKDPEDRFPSGEVLCEELVHLLHERGETGTIRTMIGPSANTISSARPAVRTRRRFRKMSKRWWVGAAAAALFVAVAASQIGRDSGEASATPAGPTLGPSAAAQRQNRTPPPPPPTPRQLQVVTTEGATVTLNNVPITAGSWNSDTLPPGHYEVVARVPAIAGCPTSSQRSTAQLLDTGLVKVEVYPRKCGQLMIRSEPRSAQYTLRAFAGGTPRSGTLPLRDPLVLPVGVYRLKVTARYCAEFNAPNLKIEGEGVNTLRTPLICGGT